MADWQAFNRWEEEYQKKNLPELTVEESFHQLCLLWDFCQSAEQIGHNPVYFSDLNTNPHLADLIELKSIIQKTEGR